MAPRVRKMLGRYDMPCVESLMRQIEKQSKETIARFAFDFVNDHFIPFYNERFGAEPRIENAANAVQAYLSTKDNFNDAKRSILDVHAAAREAERDPVKQATLRAIGQGLSAIHTPTHALGIVFYGAAAIAYDVLGYAASADAYDAVVKRLSSEMSEALDQVSIDDECKPCMPRWFC